MITLLRQSFFNRFAKAISRKISKYPSLQKADLRLTRFFAMKGLRNPIRMELSPEYWASQSTQSHHSPLLYTEEDKITKLMLDELIEVQGKDSSYLDIGCNAGRNLNYLYKRGIRKLGGIEINRTAVDEVFKNKFPDTYKSSNLLIGDASHEIKTIPSESYDVVFSCAVLVHIPPSGIELFKHMVRVSKKYISIFVDDNPPNSWPYDFEKIFTSLNCTMIQYKRFYEYENLNEFSIPTKLFDSKKHYFGQQSLRIFIKNI